MNDLPEPPYEIRMSTSRLGPCYEILDADARIVAWMPIQDLSIKQAMAASRLFMSSHQLLEILKLFDEHKVFERLAAIEFRSGHKQTWLHSKTNIKRAIRFIETGEI